MLKLRRAVVVEADPSELAGEDASGPDERSERLEQRLRIELVGAGGGAAGDVSPAGATHAHLVRPAIADLTLVGRAEAGDEVIVNVQALDLGLGSGGCAGGGGPAGSSPACAHEFDPEVLLEALRARAGSAGVARELRRVGLDHHGTAKLEHPVPAS